MASPLEENKVLFLVYFVFWVYKRIEKESYCDMQNKRPIFFTQLSLVREHEDEKDISEHN